MASCREKVSDSVVFEVAEAAGDSSGGFDDPVNRFGRAVGGAAGVEIRQDRRLPGPQAAPELGDLWDRAGGEA